MGTALDARQTVLAEVRATLARITAEPTPLGPVQVPVTFDDVEAALEELGATATEGDQMSWAVADVIVERKRQVAVEGFSAEHDDQHQAGELACAGACYAIAAGKFGDAENYRQQLPMLSEGGSDPWPWDMQWWKPKSPREDLVRAAALIIAEIERMDRQKVGKWA